ncbi:MAG: Hsp20/alpha crystallin family protein [Gemmatimonadota bacterium]|nr:MAG: Hsp20/alpha crystallin family protein [Gemmatimonadota bacterium]
MSRFHSDIDRLFERFFDEPFFGAGRLPSQLGSWAGTWSPSVDVSEGEDEITVCVELPGVDPKDIDVSLSGDALTVSGEKREESEERREGYYHVERRFGSFRRTVPLPAPVDEEKIVAEYDKGVLTVRIEKAAAATARRIPIQVAKN